MTTKKNRSPTPAVDAADEEAWSARARVLQMVDRIAELQDEVRRLNARLVDGERREKQLIDQVTSEEARGVNEAKAVRRSANAVLIAVEELLRAHGLDQLTPALALTRWLNAHPQAREKPSRAKTRR